LCDNMEDGDVVVIDYTGRIKESGELFDTTLKDVAEEEGAVNENAKYEPIKILIGGEMVVGGLEEAVRDMEVGEKRKIEVPPEKAFGGRDGDLIKTFSESKFKNQDMNPYPGMRVTLDGQVGRILSVNSGRVRVDLNHPLSGRTLDYEVEVKEKVEDPEEEVKAVVQHYLGEEVEVEVEDKEANVTIPEGINDDVVDQLRKKVLAIKDLEEAVFEEEDVDEPEKEDKESE